MAEYEASRAMPAASEIVFDTVAQVELLHRWLPQSVRVDARPEELPVVHAENRTSEAHEAEGLFNADREQLRLEWGTRGEDRYAGWLQVVDSAAGASEVTVHLSIRDDEPVLASGFDVPGAIEEGLKQLEEEVAMRVGRSGSE
jgi:uncharacterized protein YndB with AHSA1/START domain